MLSYTRQSSALVVLVVNDRIVRGRRAHTVLFTVSVLVRLF